MRPAPPLRSWCSQVRATMSRCARGVPLAAAAASAMPSHMACMNTVLIPAMRRVALITRTAPT